MISLIRSVLVALTLLALPTWVRAEETDASKQALLAGARSAFDAAEYGELYALGSDLITRYPNEPMSWYWAGTGAFATIRRNEASQLVAKGLERFPDNADLLGLRATIWLSVGDESGARADVRRALEIDPEAGDASFVAQQLASADRARARLEGLDPQLAPGSPAQVVDELCAKIAAGADPTELAYRFDLEILESFEPSKRNPIAFAEVLRSFLREAKAEDFDTIGWFVIPETELIDGRHWVTVELPTVFTFTAENRRFVEVGYADPRTRDAIDPVLRAALESVPEAEWPSLLDGLVGTKQRALMSLRFELVAAGDTFRISDVTRDGMSIKRQLAAFGDLERQVNPEPEKKPVDVAYQAGRLFGGLLVIGAILWFALRRRRVSARRGRG